MNVKSIFAAIAVVLAVPTMPARAMEPGAAAQQPYYSSAKSTLGELVDNPETRAIIGRYLPEVVNNRHVGQARHLTLRDMQPLAPQLITDEKLARIDEELAKVPAPPN